MAGHSVLRPAFTLVEAILAMLVVSIAVIAVATATTSGHQHLQYSDIAMRATRLAEHLVEEIVARDYYANGVDRTSFGISDYAGFSEDPGDIADFSAELYEEEYQAFDRSASVTDVTITIAAWENFTAAGKTISVSVAQSEVVSYQLSRFVAAPTTP